jgi:hypothetical protein
MSEEAYLKQKMTLQVNKFNEYHCDVCGETFRMYDWVEPPAECPKCKKIPPEDFDYPLLYEAIDDVLGTFRDDVMRYIDERQESLLDEIKDGFRWRLKDKKERNE